MARIYEDCKELMTEVFRDVWEMGKLVRPKTYQNKDISFDDKYRTKEVMDYQYTLLSLGNKDMLFLTDDRSQEWAKKEFEERLYWDGGKTMVNPGKAYLIRDELWRPFLVKYKFDYTYNERIRYLIRGWDDTHKDSWDNNLDKVIRLLKGDKDTRKAVLPIFSLDDVKYNDGTKRIPCSMYYNFLCRKNGKDEYELHIKYHQRSSDVMAHFGNDVYLAWGILEYVASCIGVKTGTLTHTIDSLHAYAKDWDNMKTLIGEMV